MEVRLHFEPVSISNSIFTTYYLLNESVSGCALWPFMPFCAKFNSNANPPLHLYQLTKLISPSGELTAVKPTFADFKHSYNARPPFRGSFPTAQFHVSSCIVVQGCNRPRAAVLLSSEPRAASEKVKLCKLMQKKKRQTKDRQNCRLRSCDCRQKRTSS